MTEIDQNGGISPSHSDDGSEKQQQSSYSDESEDIDSLQDKCPSFNQASPHVLETPSSKAKAENVPENVINGKGVLESAGTLLSSDEAANWQNYGQATQTHESGGSSGKKRRSRWDSTLEEGVVTNEGGCSGKKKKSRWATEEPKISVLGQTKLPDVTELSGKKKRSRWDTEEPKMSFLGQSKFPDFMKELSHVDAEVRELNSKLFMINQRLRTGNVIGPSSDGKRSPSPEPIYNELGMRMNTREIRTREKLIQERDMTIARLNAKNPALWPPADFKKNVIFKPHKKIYIPVKEYPGYNFIGLILGPCGNNKKRMEQETGAKIFLRGKGSKKEGSGRKDRPDPSDDEDLHFMVEADDVNALEKACTMVEKLLVPVEEESNELKRAQLKELGEMKGTIKLCLFCGQGGHLQAFCPVRKKSLISLEKVSSQGTKVDITNDHDLCFELGTGKLAASMEKSGSGYPRQSIQPLGSTGNYMSSLAQAEGLEHPQNGNVRIGPEVMRVSTEKRGSEVPIQSSQPLGFTDSYMAWLAGGLEHPESVNPGIVPGKMSVEKSVSGLPRQSTQPLGLTDDYMTWLPGGLEHPENVNTGVGAGIRKVSIEKSGSGLPRQSTQSRGLTDNYMSWLTGGLQHPESGKDGIGPEINKVSLEKSGSVIPRQSTQPLGLRDNYLSWLAGGLERIENGSAGIASDISKGHEFGISSVQGSRLHGYSPNFSHVGLESGFDSLSFSHMRLGPRFEHNYGKEIDHSNIYVGYLPPTMEEEQLIKLFSPFGRIVEAKVIRDDVKGSSKGYGFVKFYNIQCAAQAIAHMNGYRLEDKTLAVRVAGWPPGSGMGPAEDLYTSDKQQPPRLPVHSGDYAQISWNPSTRGLILDGATLLLTTVQGQIAGSTSTVRRIDVEDKLYKFVVEVPLRNFTAFSCFPSVNVMLKARLTYEEGVHHQYIGSPVHEHNPPHKKFSYVFDETHRCLHTEWLGRICIGQNDLIRQFVPRGLSHAIREVGESQLFIFRPKAVTDPFQLPYEMKSVLCMDFCGKEYDDLQMIKHGTCELVTRSSSPFGHAYIYILKDITLLTLCAEDSEFLSCMGSLLISHFGHQYDVCQSGTFEHMLESILAFTGTFLQELGPGSFTLKSSHAVRGEGQSMDDHLKVLELLTDQACLHLIPF